jgi:hypothetical protein
MTLFLRSRLFFTVACISVCAFCANVARSEPPPGSSSSPSANAPQADKAQATASANSSASSDATEYITVPGPLRSFLRMAGISQKATPDEVLPLLGHFVETYGFEGSKERSPKATEALVLFRRYFVQANTLASLAGPEQVIHFSTCQEARQLIADIGYKLTNGCSANPSIEVEDQDKAFITVDSGFPLADLEEDLRNGNPFSTPYPSIKLPVIYSKREWTGKTNPLDIDVVEALANDAALSRLYWALSRVDVETRQALLKTGGVAKMKPLGSVLDFYGSNIEVENGRVVVPGGVPAEPAWKKLVGSDPGQPGDFILHLLAKDGGWLAEYYDTLSRAPQAQVAYFTSGDHLARFYGAFHGSDTSADSVRSIFRPGASLLLLVTRLPFDDRGQPLVPGNLVAWRDAFRKKSPTKEERDLARRSDHWNTPDQFVEGLLSLARFNSINGPLDMYATLGEIDRNRAAGQRMSPDTAKLLIAHYGKLHDQYEVFSEFAGLSDASIAQFVKTTERIDAIREPLLRGDTMGLFEANIGLWQIFARQGQIPSEQMNESWQRAIQSFGAITSSPQLFDATRTSLADLVKTATGSSEVSQDGLIALLAGPRQSSTIGQQVHDKLANSIRAVMTDQRLVSLDALLELGDDFNNLTKSPNAMNSQHAAELAEELEEARAPRAMFTEAERAEWAPGHEPNRHVMFEMRTDLKKSIGPSMGSAAAGMRGDLTPFLRDTLVGMNYAYYEPPGAQILHNSPLLVREHDFLASESVGENRSWLAPQLFGIGLTAGNGTHLSGSLAGLPYALAEIEQDFIVPENVQALIWHDTAADLLTTGVVPRWWSTSRDALHAVALYQKAGEELVTTAAKDASVRADVTAILAIRIPPETMDEIDASLNAGSAEGALDKIAPADEFYLTGEFHKKFPSRDSVWGPAGTELAGLIQRDPTEVTPELLSQDFGVPHPALAQNYREEMLNLRPFPSVMDYASELLAESWESTNLYWARLADEAGYTPVMLNELAPALTRRMVEKIFGSDFDDWPALIRAMRETGDEFRRGQMTNVPKVTASLR